MFNYDDINILKRRICKNMKDKITNRVDVLGYLRENNLEMKSTPKGRSVQGSITVAFDKLNSIRINVFASEKSSEKGTENKAFKSLLALLPNATTSIKSQLEANPSATFDTVKDLVTKISAHCELQEYAVRDENGKEVSRVKVQLLNWFDSIHVADPTKPFDDLGAKFTIDAYVESIRPETKKVGEDVEETGRYLISGLTPDYKGVMQRITYVTEAGGTSEYIAEHWHVGESTYFTGVVNNLMVVEQKTGIQEGFGQAASGTTTTTFIEERLIRGGGRDTVDANEYDMAKAGFTRDDVKNGLTLREQAINDNTTKKASKGTTTTTQPQPAKDFGLLTLPKPKSLAG